MTVIDAVRVTETSLPPDLAVPVKVIDEVLPSRGAETFQTCVEVAPSARVVAPGVVGVAVQPSGRVRACFTSVSAPLTAVMLVVTDSEPPATTTPALDIEPSTQDALPGPRSSTRRLSMVRLCWVLAPGSLSTAMKVAPQEALTSRRPRRCSGRGDPRRRPSTGSGTCPGRRRPRRRS